MTDTTIRCRCDYTVNGHCSRCENVDGRRAGPVTVHLSEGDAMWRLLNDVPVEVGFPLSVTIIVLVFVAFLFSGCPGQGEETAPGDPETCCACLYDAFPAVGEPCIYESATSCQEGVKEGGSGPDTWGICLAELCGDVCDGVGPFDVIRWEP